MRLTCSYPSHLFLYVVLPEYEDLIVRITALYVYINAIGYIIP